ncbi:MAG: MATE family efflux transporter [Bacteroidota bacterium]|nr:MATE family efflux transporter [Bacteroidota bacterium]
MKIALPISFAMLVPQLNFIINNIFLGHYNIESLATASITGVYYLIFAGIGYGLNNGLQALIARRAGENRPEEIGKIFKQGIYIALCIATIGILVTWFIAPIIFKQVIKSAETYDSTIAFIRIRIWGLPFLYVYQMRNALLVGTNQSRYLVAGTLAEALANVFFDYAFIFGKLGFPALGFNGAAIASIIAEFIGMFVIFMVIQWKGIGKRFSLFRNFKWDAHNSKLIISISAPLIFQHAISIISWLFFYILIERNSLTQYDLAISNTMRNVFGFFGVFVWSFAATSSAMVSNTIGQGRKEEVIYLINKIARISILISLMICLILNIFPRLFISIYGQGDEFIMHAIPVVRIVSFAMVLMSFSIVWLNAVTGTGNSRFTLLIEACTIILYCIYVYMVFEKYHLPITFGWMSEWLYWISLFSLSFIYIRSGRWKNKVI